MNYWFICQDWLEQLSCPVLKRARFAGKLYTHFKSRRLYAARTNIPAPGGVLSSFIAKTPNMFRKSSQNSLLPLLIVFEWVLVICLAGGLILAVAYQARLKPALVPFAGPTGAATHTPLPTQIATSTPVFTVSPSSTASPTVTPSPIVRVSPTSTPSPTASNSGGRIVYTCTPEQYNQLCMMDADGGNQVRLTSRKAA